MWILIRINVEWFSTWVRPCPTGMDARMMEANSARWFRHGDTLWLRIVRACSCHVPTRYSYQRTALVAHDAGGCDDADDVAGVDGVEQLKNDGTANRMAFAGRRHHRQDDVT
jgi:hypothetical protein